MATYPAFWPVKVRQSSSFASGHSSKVACFFLWKRDSFKQLPVGKSPAYSKLRFAAVLPVLLEAPVRSVRSYKMQFLGLLRVVP